MSFKGAKSYQTIAKMKRKNLFEEHAHKLSELRQSLWAYPERYREENHLGVV